MPASRKRNKGKDRKARQQAKKEENERSIANTLWRGLCNAGIGCEHGCGAMISNDHPVSTFMDQFIVNLDKGNENFALLVSETLKDSFKSHIQIWNDESYRRLAIGMLVRIGTNTLLYEAGSKLPICLAHCIVILEHYDGSGSITPAVNFNGSISKRRDLQPDISSTCRDVLKFYRKRVSCKCLKKMHLEARKNKPKMGLCWHCGEEMERVHLYVCSQCTARQYCSRECQAANWSKHKIDCGIFSQPKYQPEKNGEGHGNAE